MVDLEQQNTEYWSKNTLSMGTNAILDSVTLDNYKNRFDSSLLIFLGLTKFITKNFFSISFGWLNLTMFKLNIGQKTHFLRIQMLF